MFQSILEGSFFFSLGPPLHDARPPRPAGAPTRWRAQALGLESRYHYVVVFLICETEQEPTNMEPDKCAGAGP